jgi:hypothetical protein
MRMDLGVQAFESENLRQMETTWISNGMRRYKFEARNSKSETNPNDGMTKT